MEKRDFQKSISQIEMVEEDVSSYDELPYDIAPLPSKGRLYPEGHPLHMKESVEFKAMTAHEENILATPALLKQGTVLDVLMKSCLVNKGINPLSLLVGDKSVLLLKIRISGFGSEYIARTICPACGKDFKHTFSLNKVELRGLGADPIEEGQNLFEYMLPKTKKKIKFSLTTDGDDLDVAKTQEARKKAIQSAIIDTTITDRLKIAIKEVDGKKDKEFISKFVERMPAFDSRKLRQYMSKIEPAAIMKEDVVCKHCGEVQAHRIPMGYDFFWPTESEFD